MNEKVIWDFLYSKLLNSYGTAGLMGNLYVESKLNPKNLQGSAEKKLGMTDEEYTNAVDNGSYLMFKDDRAGYGLAQWTYPTRKEKLLELAKRKETSIGALDTQLEYLWDELQTYKTCVNALKAAVSVRQASDVVVDRYEKPSDRSEKGKQNRANFGQKFYDMFVKKTGKYVVVTKDKVNIRKGNAKTYAIVATANKDEMYEFVAAAGDWYAIKLPNQVAWISSEFSKIE